MTDILVLHTGGTIGMTPGPDGLRPAEGLVEQALTRLAGDACRLTVHSFQPLIDSADMGPRHWNRLIDAIAEFHGTQAQGTGDQGLGPRDRGRGRGVIVTHGTDTMAFTGAALAHALAGITIPVVLCGAMRPLGMGGDAETNLALALATATQGAPGLWLAFAGQILPAEGLVKHHSRNADSFRSVPQAMPQPTDPGPFRPRRFADRRLAILTASPDMPAAAVAAMLAHLDGAVLRVFGAGTVGADPALIAALSDAVARGCRIRAVSQCEAGGLEPGAYAAGAALWRAGVENGGTETPEAALARLWLDMS